MPDSLVGTKLIAPRLRARAVARPRLEELLQRGSGSALTLVSAPAGFGKTTMLGAWLAGGGERHTAWVSLDDRDKDPDSFWTYVLVAVERCLPGTGASALGQLQSGQVSLETVLTTLLNELSVLDVDLHVVLDDFHLADGPELQPGMTFLVEHLPPQVHLVISSRVDPALPLSRLRARGDLVEVRAADLRFTEAEAGVYLNDVHALGLEAADVTALESRTEGWAAALQLAALSLEGRDDPGPFIVGFAGDDRFVVDYLADEVLDRQPSDVRRFLLDTAVLAQLTGALCDAVTGRTDGRAVLDSLERQNLFVVPLDAQRQWYRYHHLFADVLQARLLDERPDDLPLLHRRASDWFADAGDHESAVRHALESGESGLAADLVELAIPDLRRGRREGVIRRWLDDLPASVVRNRPVLALGLVGALMASNEFAGVDQRLRQIQEMTVAPSADVVVRDHVELARLPATVEAYWAALALVRGDPSETVERAQHALSLSRPDDLLTLASASALLGLARWTRGELAAALQAYREAAGHLERAEHVADVLGCCITIADLEVALGRLGEARRTLDHALELAAREDSPPRGTADMHVGLARVAWERGDLPRSAQHLRNADELGESAGLPQNAYRWRVGLARLRWAEGDVATALALLEDAERAYVGDFSPDVQPVGATRAQALVAAGDLVNARRWAERRGLSPTDDVTYLREHEHLTLARILLAEHARSRDDDSLADVVGLLERLLTAAEAGGRVRTAIEVLALRSVAEEAAGETGAALSTLGTAARLAEPEGYVQALRHEGAAVGSTVAPGELIDPLSSRELDVLRFLASDLDGPSIAREMGVSLSTVRTHTQHIYTKLAVTNRRAAVRRAHQLNLFARHVHHPTHHL